MSMRRSPEEFNRLQSTAGWEGELRAICFVLIAEEKITLAGDDILPIFDATKTGVSCVQDDVSVSSKFLSELTEIAEIAETKDLAVDEDRDFTFSHIFEFVTSPVTTLKALDMQFKEVVQIESHLIQYILQHKKANPHLRLISVAQWIDDYNEDFPQNVLSKTIHANQMHIVVDYTVKNLLKKTELQSLDASGIQSLSRKLQKESMHNVQFNFVASLTKKMGSALMEMAEANSHVAEAENYIQEAQQTIQAGADKLIKLGYTLKAANEYLQDLEKAITNNKQFLSKHKTQINILLQAENHAEAACHYIRSQFGFNKKLAKLEGFFFLLSMRILTETTYLPLPNTMIEKNKYIFLLKTKLSDLIHSLSAKDKILLKKINSKWDESHKEQLLKLIAGSNEVLSMRYKLDNGTEITIQTILESALHWTENPESCDLLPRSPTKPIVLPLEPGTIKLRGKSHNPAPLRVLFEYRSSPQMNVGDSQKEMENTLQRANELCKTTFVHKNRAMQWNKETALDYFYKRADSKVQQASMLKWLQLYNPPLFHTLQEEKSTVLQSLSNEAKPIAVDQSVDDTVEQVFQFIIKEKEIHADELEAYLKQSLSHQDSDTTLKQINYLFLLVNESEELSEDHKDSLEQIIVNIYAEKIFSHFKFPLEPYDEGYINFIQERYVLTNHIAEVIEFLGFLKFFSTNHVADIEIKTTGHTFEYSIKPTVNINEMDSESFTLLDYACDLKLLRFIYKLLESGAKASENTLWIAKASGVLTRETPELHNALLKAHENPVEHILRLAEKNRVEKIISMANLVGEEKLEDAIKQCEETPKYSCLVKCLQQAQKGFKQAKLMMSFGSLTDSPRVRMFLPNEQREMKKETTTRLTTVSSVTQKVAP